MSTRQESTHNVSESRERLPKWFLLAAFCITCVCIPAGAATPPRSEAEFDKLVDEVSPIDWGRFGEPLQEEDEHYGRCLKMVLNSARYNFAWARGAAERIDEKRGRFRGKEAHNIVRPACGASYALAVVLKVGIFDEKSLGVSKREGLARTIRLIEATAAAHGGKSWEYPWQSTFWAATLAHGGWILWDDLDPPTRRKLCEIVEYEANRFLAPGYRVPYWNGRDGNTRAEENAWDSMIFQVACAMMPGHPNVPRWKEVCSKLMVSAYALEEDMRSETVLDGRAVKDWLDGYNVRKDGAVINHNRLHPDYMTVVFLNLRANLTQSLVGQPVPEAADFRAEFMYRTLATRKWPSPPYKQPGGTIFVPGSAEVYYPQGTDWDKCRVVTYYRLDVCAHIFGWDRGLPHPASHWMRLRADEILARQSRHPDGHIYGVGEFERLVPREQDAVWLLTDCFLLQWLHARRALSPKGNWLTQ